MEIKLEDLNSDQWEKHSGAYGNMSNLMSDFMKDPDDKELQESVYQSVNHQMTFYSAVYLVMPYLVKLLEQKILSGDIEWAEYCLFNVGMTFASDNMLTRRGSRKLNVTKELKQKGWEFTRRRYGSAVFFHVPSIKYVTEIFIESIRNAL